MISCRPEHEFAARFAASRMKLAQNRDFFWHDACGSSRMQRVAIALAFGFSIFACAAATPAQADFFSLEGRFECLERGDAVCGDAEPVMRPAPPSAPAAPESPLPVIAPPPVSITSLMADAPPGSAPGDALQAVAARIQARRPSSGDLALLAQSAKAGNARAIELLAWCKLNGIGMQRDPVEAYLLYGAAASGALPSARENQILIYERDLDSAQRQQVLALVDQGIALAEPSPPAE
jgi:hypothetical protein